MCQNLLQQPKRSLIQQVLLNPSYHIPHLVLFLFKRCRMAYCHAQKNLTLQQSYGSLQGCADDGILFHAPCFLFLQQKFLYPFVHLNC
jgi:hypothetical protein